MTGDVSSALLYLIGRTTRNRVGRQLQRLRRPKYFVFALLGVGYFWLVFYRRPSLPGHDAPGLGWSGLIPVIAVGLLLAAGGSWLTRGTGSALAFAPAEVQFLFTGPLSRRALLAYRVGRAQIVVILNAFVWTLLAHRFGATLPGVQRFMLAWGFVTLLSLHRIGAALVRVAPVSPARRATVLLVRGYLAATALAIVAAAQPLYVRVNDLGWEAGLHALAPALSEGIAGALLLPFRLLLAPAAVPEGGSFLVAFLPMLAAIALHLGWILSMDVAFEEAAATASANQAQAVAKARRFQAGGVAVPTSTTSVKRRSLPLAPVGHPAWAIIWKNTMAFLRTRMYVPLVIITAVGFFVGQVAVGPGGRPWEQLAPVCGFAAILIVLGPRFLRNDLRLDLLSLTSLKVYPLSGRQMVAAQLGSPALILTATQLLLMLVGLVQLPAKAYGAVPASLWLLGVVFVPPLLLGLNLLALAIQNGTALLFPAWIRLGADGGGIETIGQNILVSVGSIFVLLLLVILPVGLGVALLALGDQAFDLPMAVSALAGGAVTLAVLGVELTLLARWLGGVFERSDLTVLA